ncbi:MOSC domain-containing protein [Herbiconiux sp. L3-i23]|uniref:MOSC domain-containing protein n=1 Tax=Herbiconiux sp. L3-i23 TaxID=2905871 RepID=UPI00207330A5|nr:MOSC domain-containing protein [Herbiconiux sp. L3-i23]
MTEERRAQPTVVAVSADGGHRFRKRHRDVVNLIAGWGVAGDAHAGRTDQHRSHARRDPSRINLRQVHLIHAELLDDVATRGFDVAPGELGENLTTRGIDLLALPRGARLAIGGAVLEITGLRNPCKQINGLESGLLAEMVTRGADGGIERRSGVMSVVVQSGTVRPGDAIEIRLPETHEPLQPV